VKNKNRRNFLIKSLAFHGILILGNSKSSDENI